jgi:hypothetical protein
MGGLQVNLDQQAASYLKLSLGKHTLADQSLIDFISPSISGVEGASRRQAELLHVIFNGVINKNIIPTITIAEQIIGSAESNFGATEIMDQYSKFSEKSGWQYKEFELPATIVRRNNRNCYEPQLELCRKLLTSYE